MTNHEINFRNMALDVRKLLRTTRPQWEPLYKKLLPGFTRLDTALDGFDGKFQKLVGQGSTGYTEAKDLAEIRTLDAAMPVLQGIKALQLDAPDPALAPLAAHTRTTLDELRDLPQVKMLRALHTAALARATALAGERVTAAQIAALDAKIAVFEPLIGAPRQATTAGAALRERSVASLGAARTALKRLDVRVPNLADELPELVANYKRARIIVDAGHGPKPDAAKAG